MLAEFIQYLINGLAQGAIYALIALGYTMVYGILQLINFAHGELYMVSAYFGILALSVWQLPFGVAVVVVMLMSGLLAVFIERVAYRPLRNASRIAPLITALGISIVLLEGTRVIAGAEPRSYPQPFESFSFDFAVLSESLDGVIIQGNQLLIFGVTFVMMLALHFIVMKTKMGRAMRALSMDFDACRLMGVPINRIIAFTFFIGAALAGVAGILVGMYYNNAEPYMGQLAGLKAFTAAVLGGIGVIPGAFVGAFLLGISEAFVIGYGQSSYRDAIAFAILIAVLMFRPWGLLGRPERVKV